MVTGQLAGVSKKLKTSEICIQILSIVLNVICCHLSSRGSCCIASGTGGRRRVVLLCQNTVGAGLARLAGDLVEDALMTCGLLHLEVRTLHGWLKAPFLKKPCVGLWTGTLVLGVVHSLNSLQSLKRSHDDVLWLFVVVRCSVKCS